MRPVRGRLAVRRCAVGGVVFYCTALAARVFLLHRSRGMEIEASLEVVGGCSEVDLGGGAGETAPPHSSQAVAALPGAEDLLDARPHALDRAIPGREPRQGLGVVRPHIAVAATRGTPPLPRTACV